MFSPSDFRVRKETNFPQFSQVLQSWYSPLLGNKPQEDGGYSACVTLGVASNAYRADKDVLLLSVVNGPISNSSTFIKHINALKQDYLNKTLTSIASVRVADVVLFEAEEKKTGSILDTLYNIEGIQRFYPRYHGGDDLNNRIPLATPCLSRFRLTNLKDKQELRPDDELLMTNIIGYPEPECYAITSAFVQAILYAKSMGVFEKEDDRRDGITKPKHGFYGVERE